MRRLLGLFCIAAAGCTGLAGQPDDAGLPITEDSGVVDAGDIDAGMDAGLEDAGPAIGLDSRPVNTTCIAPAPPPNTSGVTTQRAFPALAFNQPLGLFNPPRDPSRVCVLEGGPRETGMMTLKREKQLWNYLPQAGRVMKLPSGMMGDSWMGSDFTNDDLVKGSSITTDFTSRVDKTFEHEGRKAWFVTLLPRPEAKVVWGKVELVLDRQTCLPLEQRFYDEENVLARRMTYGEIKKIGWRNFP